MRRVEMIMGMPVIIDIPEATVDTIFEAVFSYLRHIDQLFSTYRDDSEVTRFNNGLLKKDDLSADVKYVLEECEYYARFTNGYFSAYYGEQFDPSGYVKSWAMQQAAHMIESAGYQTYLLNIAGDMIGSGESRIWNIAIQDPLQKDAMLGIAMLHDQSIATSGSYERGNHIVNPLTHRSDSDLISVSVYGDNIIDADVFATTCIAMGSTKATEFMTDNPKYAALLIEKNGSQIIVNDFVFAKMQTAQ
jgi:thiamine biosynthesis lipoprotein